MFNRPASKYKYSINQTSQLADHYVCVCYAFIILSISHHSTIPRSVHHSRSLVRSLPLHVIGVFISQVPTAILPLYDFHRLLAQSVVLLIDGLSRAIFTCRLSIFIKTTVFQRSLSPPSPLVSSILCYIPTLLLRSPLLPNPPSLTLLYIPNLLLYDLNIFRILFFGYYFSSLLSNFNLIPTTLSMNSS